MSSTSTLDRIQKEIKESMQREKELKNGYAKFHSNSSDSGNETNNNHDFFSESNENLPSTTKSEENKYQKPNGLRKYTPNTGAKGVMHKFLKSRGRLSLSSIKSDGLQNNWVSDAAFKPAKLTVEKGKPLRNGFVSAEEKMRKELQDFQFREAELRQERRKSQPNLMAALQLEDENEFEQQEIKMLKPAKSMANLYSADEDVYEENHSAPCSLKPARSLAELCDVSDDEVELPGTYSLILQFEKMKSQEKHIPKKE